MPTLGLLGVAIVLSWLAGLIAGCGGFARNDLEVKISEKLQFGAHCLASVAALVALIPAVQVLITGENFTVQFASPLPFGKIAFAFDALAAWFVVPLAIVTILKNFSGKNYPMNFAAGAILFGAMLLLLIAADAAAFIIAWEIMSLSAWWLIVGNSPFARTGRQRAAAWIYLFFSEFSALALIVVFALLIKVSDGFSFADFSALPTWSSEMAQWVFIAALLACGCKIGFIGIHFWMPESYGAARGEDMALLSGAMSKLAFYGLLRIIHFFPPEIIPVWWGGTLLVIGAATAVMGIIFTLLQTEVKKILAYSSMENMGILSLLLGFALIGINEQNAWSALAFSAFLLHIWHHALAKSTAFILAEKVVAFLPEIDHLGGLQKLLPRSMLAFLLASAALSALPLTSGFVPEFIAISAGLQLLTTATSHFSTIAALFLLLTLGLLGGLAIFALTRLFAGIFLGEPRVKISPTAANDHCTAALIAGGLIVIFGLAGWVLLPASARALAVFAKTVELWDAAGTMAILQKISLLFAGIGGLSGILWWWRRRYKSEPVPTWACGYSAPSARIQYTAFSFAQPLRSALANWLPLRISTISRRNFFPRSLFYTVKISEPFSLKIYRPLYSALMKNFARLRILQHGRVHLYIFYIIAALSASLFWALMINR